MSKAAYFEMCEALGTEPIDSEIPVELSDFPDLVQQTFSIYSLLRDNWDHMSGSYLGKDISIIFNIFDLYDIEKIEQRVHFTIINIIDSERASLIKHSQKTQEPSN